MRRPGRINLSTPVAMTWADADGAARYARGRTLDLSASGMRIEVQNALPVWIYVTVNAHKISLTTTASVRHCVRHRGKYLIGLEFSCPMNNLVERLAKKAEIAAAAAKLG